MYLTLFHDGKFLPDSYVDGQETEVDDVIDPDRFGFSDLAEYIKTTLGYTEIGGVYVKQNTGGWKLVKDDKDVQSFVAGFDVDAYLEFYIDNVFDKSIEPLTQMQPHVVIRPRPDFVQGKKLQPKCKYVTLHTMKKQEKQKTRMTSSVKVKRKLSVEKSVGAEKEKPEKRVQMESYEKVRDRNIEANKERLAALNLPKLAAGLTLQKKGNRRGEDNVAEGSDDYCPMNDSDEKHSDALSTRTKSVTSKKTRGRKRATQSKSGLTRTSNKGDKGEAGKSTHPSSPACNTRSQRRRVEMEGSNSTPKRPTGTTSKKAKDKKALAPSSPTANTRLQRQKNDKVSSRTQIEQEQNVNEPAAENEVQEIEEPTKVVQRRKRGKTKMVAVHARKGEEKKKISLNDKFQPICDNRKDRAEFSLFLGTVVREYVSLEYVTWHKVSNKNMLWEFVKEKYIIAEEGKPWVLKAMRDAWKVYKCRIKKDHYNKFTNDEDRIKHKPNDIPMEVFKKLLNYWGDEKVKAIAARNAANRRKIFGTHTAGLRSFSQIEKKCRQVEMDKNLL